MKAYEELRLRRSVAAFVQSGFHRNAAYQAIIDGRRCPCVRGAWATWIPDLQTKFLRSVDGKVASRRSEASSLKIPAGVPEEDRWGSYTIGEWRRVFALSAARRVAENVVAAGLLAAAGLGPRVLGLCVAHEYWRGAHRDGSIAVGFMIEDATRKPPKQPATEAEMISAGVRPDKTRSAIRQQVNGYIVDLNSVVGVVPIDADDTVAAVEARFLDYAG